MTSRRLRIPVKIFAVLMSIACLFAFTVVAVSPVLAADAATPKSSTWETWPKKAPGTPATGAAIAGEAGGESVFASINWGTWGWVLGGLAAVGLIAIAAGGGGGSSTTTVAH